jgi:hypothetical protein
VILDTASPIPYFHSLAMSLVIFWFTLIFGLWPLSLMYEKFIARFTK